MKGLIKILASVMIIMSSCINSAQAQFVGTFWVLPIDKDFPVGTKVVKLSRFQVFEMLIHTRDPFRNPIVTLLVNNTWIELTLNKTIRGRMYEGQEGNRVHVLFYTPSSDDQKDGKVIYTYYDIPNPQQEMINAAYQQGIGR